MVSAAARAAGVDRPLLTHLPPEGELPFGGWWMVRQLLFTSIYSYADYDARITGPVALRSSTRVVELVASLDTGASHRLFENPFAAEIPNSE